MALPSFFVRDENSFVLPVKGESMIGAGIYDGDFIIVRTQNYADDGDIVVSRDDKASEESHAHHSAAPEDVPVEPDAVE